MWIFLSDAFISIVAPQKGSGIDPAEFLVVRARVAGDIEKLFPEAEVITGGGTDYGFRAFVPAAVVERTVADAVNAIDYTNFKETVRTPARHEAYSRVWSVMADLQDRLQYLTMKKAGPLRNGAELGKGSIKHAVPPDHSYCGPALCGEVPAIQWTDCAGQEITCPRCIRKLSEVTALRPPRAAQE